MPPSFVYYDDKDIREGGDHVKKRLTVLILLCLMLFVSALPSQAQQWSSPNGGYVPFFAYITLFETCLDITSLGRADVDVFIYAPQADETAVSAELQQYKNFSWTTIKTWSHRSEGRSCGMGVSYYVPSGYLYRVKSYGYVYVDGEMVESTSITTSSHSY